MQLITKNARHQHQEEYICLHYLTALVIICSTFFHLHHFTFCLTFILPNTLSFVFLHPCKDIVFSDQQHFTVRKSRTGKPNQHCIFCFHYCRKKKSCLFLFTVDSLKAYSYFAAIQKCNQHEAAYREERRKNNPRWTLAVEKHMEEFSQNHGRNQKRDKQRLLPIYNFPFQLLTGKNF